MDKKVNSLIKKYSDNELSLNKLVVSAFVHCNNLTVKEGYLASYIAEKKDGLDEDISILSSECSVEDVINIFELAIPKEEKQQMVQYILLSTYVTISSATSCIPPRNHWSIAYAQTYLVAVVLFFLLFWKRFTNIQQFLIKRYFIIFMVLT